MPNKEAAPALDSTINGEKDELSSSQDQQNKSQTSDRTPQIKSSTSNTPSNPAALFTTLLIITKTDGKVKRILIQGQWQNNLAAITNGRGSHWSWFTSEGGYIVKIEDVSELEVNPFTPESNATS